MHIFSLAKFRDILSRVKRYIEENQATGLNYNLTLAGDFNFPERVVKWIESDDGIYADPFNAQGV